MSSFTDSERYLSLLGLGGFWHDKTANICSCPYFGSDAQDPYHKPQKIISITRFIRQFNVFSWKQKAPMFIKLKCNQTGNSSCYLRNGGGWGLSTVLLFRQPHLISVCLYNVLLASSISSQPQGDLTGNCAFQLYRNYYPVGIVCIHISARTFLKFYSTDSLQGITQRAIKTRAFPTPVGESSSFGTGFITLTNTSFGFFLNYDCNKVSTRTLQFQKEM